MSNEMKKIIESIESASETRLEEGVSESQSEMAAEVLADLMLAGLENGTDAESLSGGRWSEDQIKWYVKNQWTLATEPKIQQLVLRNLADYFDR